MLSNLLSAPVGRPRYRSTTPRVYLQIFLITFAFACLFNSCFALERVSNALMIPPLHLNNPSLSRRAVANSSKLQCLEAVPPVIAPDPAQTPCTQTLMVYSFGNSYGKPFVGQYQPPSCQFNRVVINFTATSAGRQFDRLAIMYLGDTEVWRTSTAEPTNNGIIWTYMKDMSNYLSLWKQPQSMIFDLGNIVNDIYTGPFNTTLTAIFFNAPQSNPPADTIIPVSSRKSASGGSSAFQVPDSVALNIISIPRNAKKAVFSLSACGQMDEEFWWSNAPDSTTGTFTNNTLLGHSPFREVQLLIDGQVAGVAWPFPVVFTGGIVPGFWRPVVGIDAFDLREDEIDLTPWLPVLCDGKEHSYEIRVVGLSDDGQGNAAISSIGGYWVVTGKIFLWLDTAGSITTGSPPTVLRPDPQFFVTSEISKTSNASNVTLNYQVLAQRQLSTTNTITTSEGPKKVSWTQTLSYSNIANFVNNGMNQTNNMVISGNEVSSGGYSRKFVYPLFVFSSFNQVPQGPMSIYGRLDRSKNVQISGTSAFPSPLDAYAKLGPFDGSTTTNRQNGTAYFFQDPSKKVSMGSGITEQNTALQGIKNMKSSTPQIPMGGDPGPQLFTRHILAANNSILADSGGMGISRVIFNVPEDAGMMLSEFSMVRPEQVIGGKIIRNSDADRPPQSH